VIELDESGDYKLFFQFVPVDLPIENNAEMFSTLAVTVGIAAMAMIGLMVAWSLFPEYEVIGLAEWGFRGIGLVAVGILIFAGGWSLATTDPEQQASTGFSILLHGALLIGTIVIYKSYEDPNVWPGPRALTGNYLVTRLELEKPPEKPPPQVGKQNKEEAAAKSETKKNIKTATKNEEGASGGKGEKERARDPNAKDVPPDPPKVAFFEDKNRKVLDNIIDRSLSSSLGKFTGIKGDTLKAGSIGFGPGAGTGVGEGTGTGTTRGSKGKGSGGGGQVEGDFVTNKGKVDTGKERPGGTCTGPNCKGAGPREVKVSVGEMTGDPGGYTEDEINRVVKARAGVFRACYQKELNRSPGIGGKIVIKFKIGADGSVQAANATGGSTLTNDAVQGCVSSNVMRLRFPPKGAIANVTYPFLFAPGG
ncbi:MAG: AgmX/PglI C-terminal domain-containing protein, partial [Kofleriaceae bacterium]